MLLLLDCYLQKFLFVLQSYIGHFYFGLTWVIFTSDKHHGTTWLHKRHDCTYVSPAQAETFLGLLVLKIVYLCSVLPAVAVVRPPLRLFTSLYCRDVRTPAPPPLAMYFRFSVATQPGDTRYYGSYGRLPYTGTYTRCIDVYRSLCRISGVYWGIVNVLSSCVVQYKVYLPYQYHLPIPPVAAPY